MTMSYLSYSREDKSWRRHQMEAFSALLALCVGNSLVTGEFPSQRPVTRSFDVCFDLRLNKRLSKQSRRRWFETQLRLLWRHCNEQISHQHCPLAGFHNIQGPAGRCSGDALRISWDHRRIHLDTGPCLGWDLPLLYMKPTATGCTAYSGLPHCQHNHGPVSV